MKSDAEVLQEMIEILKEWMDTPTLPEEEEDSSAIDTLEQMVDLLTAEDRCP